MTAYKRHHIQWGKENRVVIIVFITTLRLNIGTRLSHTGQSGGQMSQVGLIIILPYFSHWD